MNLDAAQLIGKDYPYYIFNDEGVLRYCEDPKEYGPTTTACWTNGISIKCDVITPEEGYIDCKSEDE